jgi:hypothetical protein
MPIKRLAALAAVFLCLALSACHSPYVETTITNRTGAAVSLIEVDYPDASFGTQQIAVGETFHYRFKILGPTPGPVKISFTTPDRKVHTATGPTLNPGQQGTLSVSLDADGHVEWASGLSPK